VKKVWEKSENDNRVYSFIWHLRVAKFLSHVRSNKINSPKNRTSQILVIALKNRSNEIRIRQELPVPTSCKIY